MAYFKYTLFYLKTLTWVKANIHMGQSAKPGFWFEYNYGLISQRGLRLTLGYLLY